MLPYMRAPPGFKRMLGRMESEEGFELLTRECKLGQFPGPTTAPVADRLHHRGRGNFSLLRESSALDEGSDELVAHGLQRLVRTP